MRRWLSGLLAALMLLTLTGCGMAAADMEGPDLAWAAEDPWEGESPDSKDAEAPLEGGEEAPEHSIDPDSDIPSGLVSSESNSDLPEIVEPLLPEDGAYTTKEDVALYIYLYGRLPDNFITKKEAQDLGWSGGSLEPYAPGQGLCIGGSYFGNYEGLLPEAEGRSYTECDIDTMGAKSRGAKRIVFSNDGLIYYTEDHYETFELLYGDEGDG